MSFTRKFASNSGCSGTTQSRGSNHLFGRNLSLEACQQACLAAGPSVCNELEFAGSDNYNNCLGWSGTCEFTSQYNGVIYVPHFSSNSNQQQTLSNQQQALENEEQIALLKQQLLIAEL